MSVAALRRGTLAECLVICLLFLVPTQSFAQQLPPLRPPDKGIEAAGYLAQADNLLYCEPESSRNWSKKALDTVSGARAREAAVIDMLGDLKAQSNLRIAEAEKRRDNLQSARKGARSAMKHARLETASALLKDIDAQSCYAGHESIRTDIANQKLEAENLVRQGDLMVNQRPKDAIKYYERAGRVNAEFSDLLAKLEFAHEAERRRPKSHKTSVIVVILVVGAIAAAGYDRRSKQNK